MFKYLFAMSRIINLSEAASIALHAMILIARQDGSSINVDKIAENTNSSRHHVAKVMQRLAKDGFVGSSRGPTGGFFLTRNPEEISLLDIYEAIEGRIVENKCPMEKPVCTFDKCFLNNIAHDLTITFKNYMKEHTLAQYI